MQKFDFELTTDLPEWIEEEVKRAAELSLAARWKAEAGDQVGAAQLRDEYDAIYDHIFERLGEVAPGSPEANGSSTAIESPAIIERT